MRSASTEYVIASYLQVVASYYAMERKLSLHDLVSEQKCRHSTIASEDKGVTRCDRAYQRILTPYTKEGVESLRILPYTIGGQAVNG